MKNELDQLLKYVLAPAEEPDERLNQGILNQVKERENRKKRIGKRMPAAALAAAVVIGCASLTVAAGVVVKLLSVQEAAERISDVKLRDAFSREDAVLINKTQSYGGYDVTFLGIVSGEDLSDSPLFCDGIEMKDRTYSVVAIAHKDGTPIIESYGVMDDKEFFFSSPLIRGFDPAFCNLFMLNGTSRQFLENGVLYQISDCDNVEMFADHGLYLCVCDSSLYNSEAYRFDEATGVISRNEEYKGLNALFDLPIDASKADPEAAENYLKSDAALAEKFLGIPRADGVETLDFGKGNYKGMDKWKHQITPENIDEYADRLENSVQILTPDKEGFVECGYEDEDGRFSGTVNVNSVFEDGKKFVIIGLNISRGPGEESAEKAYIETLQKNKDGTVTYACYRVKQSVLESE